MTTEGYHCRMRIITLNVNGVRSAARRGLFPFLAKQNADVVCAVPDIEARGRTDHQ